MFDKMGKKKYLVPLGALCGFLLLMSLLMYPMLHSNPVNVPYAILSLDQGIETPAGQVNAGQALVDKVSGAQAAQDGEDPDGSSDSPIAWTVFTSQEDFDSAMEDSQFYGGAVIPADFTQKQLDAQAQPSVQIITDSAKNASLSQSLQSSLTSTLKDAGIAVETSAVHDVDPGNSTAASMIGQLSVAPLLAMSMTGGLIMFLVTRAKKGASRAERAKTFAIQLGYAAGLSLCAALADVFIAGVVGGLNLPLAAFLSHQWLCSFCIMTFLLGIMNIAFGLGTVGMMVCMGTMSCACIAPEMLPQAWLDWVYPWSPARFVVEGARQVVFLGAGALNSSSLYMLVFAVIGLGCGLVGVLLAGGGHTEGEGVRSAAVNAPAAA